MKAFTLFTMFLGLFAQSVCAEQITLENAELKPDDISHLTVTNLPDWTLSNAGAGDLITWVTDDRVRRVGVSNGVTLSQSATVPDTKKSGDGSEVLPLEAYYGLLSVDSFGLKDKGAATVAVTLRKLESSVDAITGENVVTKTVIGTYNFTEDSSEFAKTSKWSVLKVSSGNSTMQNALDNDLNTRWSSSASLENGEQFIVIDLGESQRIEGIIYERGSNSTTGYIKEYEVYVSDDSESFPKSPAASGVNKYVDLRDPRQIYFDQAVTGRYVKLVAKSDVAVGDTGFTSVVGEFNLIGGQESARTRHWFYLPPAIMSDLNLKDIEVEITVTTDDANHLILGRVNLQRFHRTPTTRLCSSPHKSVGPDPMTAGAYGFRSITEHKHHATSVYDVFSGSVAETAGLQVGDLIVEVNDRFMPSHDAAGDWGRFKDIHDEILGDALKSVLDPALGSAYGKLSLTILRPSDSGFTRHVLNLDFSAMPNAIQDVMSLDDPSFVAMHRDVLDYLASRQYDSGLFPARDNISALAGLALLGSKDLKYAENIHKLAAGIIAQHPVPSEVSESFFYTGVELMFMAEYAGATGNERAKKWVKDTLIHIPNCTHRSRLGTLALGHGRSGLPYSNKALMSPMSHLLAGEGVARKLGIYDGMIWETCSDYIDSCWGDPARGRNGTMGYNYSYIDSNEFWSRTGLSSVALHLRDEKPEMKDIMLDAMEARYSKAEKSHAYGQPGSAFGYMGLAGTRPAAFDKIYQTWNWQLQLSWKPGFGLYYNTPLNGAPYMAGDFLQNACFGMLMSRATGGLHLTGGNPDQWLPDSEMVKDSMIVKITSTESGLITMSTGDGLEIYFSTDGSTPSLSSLKYRVGFNGVLGMKIRARAYDPVAKKFVGIVFQHDIIDVLTSATVTRATGFIGTEDEQAGWDLFSIERAKFAFDGSLSTEWATNNGEGKQNWESGEDSIDSIPHEVELDFNGVREIHNLSMHFVSEGNTPKKIELYSSEDGETWVKVQSWTQAAYQAVVEFKLDNILETQYLKLSFIEPFIETSNSMIIKEIDFTSISPGLEFDDVTRLLSMTAPAGYEIRYTLDGSLPHSGSVLYTEPIQIGSATVQAYAFVPGATEPKGALAVLTTSEKISLAGATATASSAWSSGYVASFAIDGDPSTYWHSRNRAEWPHFIVIDLGSVQTFNAFYYLPRNGSSITQKVDEYHFYAGEQEESMSLVSKGVFSELGYDLSSTGVREAYFDKPVTARYIKLEAKQSTRNKHMNYMAVAEFGVLNKPYQNTKEGLINLDYTSWLDLYGGVNDGDGFSSAFEYALGLDPTKKDGEHVCKCRIVKLDAGDGEKSYSVLDLTSDSRSIELGLEAQISTNLALNTWKGMKQAIADGEVVIMSSTLANDGLITTTYRSTASTDTVPTLFYRLYADTSSLPTRRE